MYYYELKPYKMKISAVALGCNVKLTSAEWYLLYRESRQSELLK